MQVKKTTSEQIMVSNHCDELTKWQQVKDAIHTENIVLGQYCSYQLRNTPRRILFSLSYYKFAAKLLGKDKNILEVGCNEGLGTMLLGEFARKVTAIDIDVQAVATAKRNFSSNKIQFEVQDFLQAELGEFDGLVSLDVVEHIFPENVAAFFSNIYRHLTPSGICVIGTPNKMSEQYASEVSKLGHVNVYTAERLRETMEEYFQQVFIFSANDELVHTGFYPMAHYLLAVGICKKEV